jgi:pyrophosphate--fructose-6-phosphate 1-phosphotransferase
MSGTGPTNVAFMTSGGLAPCLTSSVAHLIKYWKSAVESGKVSGVSFRCYKDGYKGILTNDSFVVPEEVWKDCDFFHSIGGSPIGNSRVKLTNIKDCIKRGFVGENEDPLEAAAQRLIADKVNVLHTVGGDDTNTQAAELSKYILEKHGGKVIVIGMPKTIDNDVYPIKQTFGADTAAEQGALYFENIVSESTANPRMLILHECMGRDSGFLTAMTAYKYRENYLKKHKFVEGFSVTAASRDVHAVWIPETNLDIEGEGARLKKIMDVNGNVNIFLSEGSGVKDIVAEMEARGEEVPRDAFGHVALAKINPGLYFSKRIASLIGAEKTIVQKSGYFARSAASNAFDQGLIGKCAEEGVASAIAGVSGCMGEDEDKEGTPIRAIEFERVKGGKPFDTSLEWFQTMLKEIGQI